jgi:hypothetical protein
MNKYYTLNDLISDEELYHHGIKGQKWGIRRFQNKDGSLTPAGKKRYGDDGPNKPKTKEEKKAERELKREYKQQRAEEQSRNKSKILFVKNLHESRVDALAEKYKQNGLSDDEAKVEAKKRAKAEALVAGAAAVTVTALGIYAVKKHKDKMNMTDRILDMETDIQRIVALSDGKEVNTNHRLYVAHDKKDKAKYRGMYGGQLLKTDPDKPIYKVKLTPDKDIKIASRDRAAKVFMDMYNGDPEFKKHYNEHIMQYAAFTGRGKFAGFKKMKEKGEVSQYTMFKKGYDLFNVALVDDHPTTKKYAEKFYGKLIEQGINAIEDRNDKIYSGYKSKDPLITFGVNYSYTKELLTPEDIKVEMGIITMKYAGKTALRMGAAYLATKGVMTYNRKHDDNKLIKEYREIHPNSELSDDEIIKVLKPYRK